ncbi:si:ch211-199f5.1 [Brachyhypopomus gauderio]|uniref:si:ch211-199f5.1 n=1 Tax=Brachyhypopomus gauderio TaxID=698409 RepID=UPI0040420694
MERRTLIWIRWTFGVTFLCVCIAGPVLSEEKTVRYKIYEEARPPTVIGTLASNITWSPDKAWRSSPGIRFKMMPQSTASFIRFRESDGRLTVEERIDREKMCKRNLRCLISFDVAFVSVEHFELFHVEVDVVDINDNSPEFPSPECMIEISENAAVGSRVPLDAAEDADVGSNSIQNYQISDNNYFGVEMVTRVDGVKYAELVLIKELDRETQASYTLKLVATDGGNPSQSGSTNVTVKVLDFNDNSPVFDQTNYSVDLFEDAPIGHLLLHLNAVDPDEDLNGQVVYEFGKQVPSEIRQLFKIDHKSGHLTLQSPVDYEEETTYEVDIQATDLGHNPVPSVCKIIIHVRDVNDNRPEVSITPITSGAHGVAHVSEATSRDSLVALISTTDSDTGANGQVTCSLHGGHGDFKLRRAYEGSYTIVTNAALDRENIPEYNLSIVAEDFGAPPLRTVTQYVIVITDVNDNAPFFSAKVYEGFIEENQLPGTYITTVLASDRDAGLNGEITYDLFDSDTNGVSRFAIMNQAGHVYALQSFNYEVVRKLELRVHASDRGWPQLQSHAMLIINIVDQNDNAPTITQPPLTNGSAEVSLPRDAAPGYIVTRIKAKDMDTGLNAELIYKLIEGADLGFSIDQDTGEIYVNRKIAYDAYEMLKVSVTVNDNGLPPLTSTATIHFTLTEGAPASNNFYSDSETNPEPKPWATSLILVLTLTSSSVLLLAGILMYLLCSRKKSHKNPAVRQNAADRSYAEKENNAVSLISHQTPNVFEAHALPSKAVLGSSETIRKSVEASAEPTLIFKSKYRNVDGQMDGYSTLPGYGKAGLRAAAVWKGNSMLTVAGRDPHISGKDSGKGDSDVNDSDSDISGEAAKKDFASYKGLWACTSECRVLGHSDRCWSPSATRANTSTTHHLSTFSRAAPSPPHSRLGPQPAGTAAVQRTTEGRRSQCDYIHICSPQPQRRKNSEETDVEVFTHSTQPTPVNSPGRFTHSTQPTPVKSHGSVHTLHTANPSEQSWK